MARATDSLWLRSPEHVVQDRTLQADVAHHLMRSRGHTGPSPVDRRKPGSKHHLITDASGVPLAVTLTGGNRNNAPTSATFRRRA